MSASDSVNVAVRVRPLVKSEIDRGCQLAIERAADGAPQVTVNRTDSFTYNYVFDSSDSQQTVYENCVLPKLKQLLCGFNVTILAYGQTGSGKTYTMGTAFNGAQDEHVGVIPRAVHDIFVDAAAMSSEFEFTVKCSFVELYQEQFYDLLSPNGRDESTVDIREDKSGIVMPGLTEIVVTSAKEVTDQLVRGSSGRAVASTAMNEQSSRSHAIFTVTVVAAKKDGKKSVTASKFNLVDLAGSERCSKTQATGDRFKEGININKGLLALGNVINALGTAQNVGYVPYRQSKLTRLLQHSLGGNSITLMIACVSPADYNVPETLSTLRYADRALQIKNKPIINMDPHAAEVNYLKDIIQKLRVELLAVGGGMSSSLMNAMSTADLAPITNSNATLQQHQLLEQLNKSQEAYKAIEKKNRKLQEELHRALVELAEHEMRAHIAEMMHEKQKATMKELKDMLEVYTKPAAAEVTLDADATADADMAVGNEERQQQLREISRLVCDIVDEHQRTETELTTRKKTFLIEGSSVVSADATQDGINEEVHELLQPQAEEYTIKQLHLNDELRDINRLLDLKQELHERVCHNYNQMYSADNKEEEEKFKQVELKMQELETERNELIDQLRNAKKKDASAKLAEDRRKRLKILEQEISDMRRKIVQQSNLLKMREKEHEKIQILSTEIKSMKESKVKLIRDMRAESERFRQWKFVREKELTQLKSKDRKMQSEMVRQNNLHAKQRQVLKRKCEEALAINKRLKDALDRQSAAQAQRQRYGNKDQTAAKNAWVDNELEVILSLIDAEYSLSQLMEDRAVINARINDLKQQLNTLAADPDGESKASKCRTELESLEGELEMRNAQIADLQQKVCVSDLESRMRALSEGVHNINESRVINKQLLESLVQQRREQAQGVLEQAQRLVEQKVTLDEQRSQLDAAEERYEALLKRMRLTESQHKELIADHERAYEEKVAVLLRAPKNHGTEPEDIERQRIIEELLAKMEAKQENPKLHLKAAAKKRQNSPQIPEDILDESIVLIESAESDDPDWVPESILKRKSQKDEKPDSANNTTNLSDISNDASSTLNSKVKRKRYCKCRKQCTTRCGCVLQPAGCTEKCVCQSNCQNPFNKPSEHKDTDSDNEQAANSKVNVLQDNKENSMPAPATADVVCKQETSPIENDAAAEQNSPNSTFVLPKPNAVAIEYDTPGVRFSAPKLARLSDLNFNTPSSKQKFF